MSESINLVLIDNAFEPTERRFLAAEYDPSKNILDYAPEDMGEVLCSLNSSVIGESPELVFPAAGDQITFCSIPHGGGDGKSFLRIAAFAALTVATGGIGGVTGLSGFALSAAQVGTTIAGSLLINAALPPPDSPRVQEFEDGESYGVGGAGNTSAEGVLVPVPYGRFRTGGNIVEYYTENVGTKNQNVSLVICAGEAPISSIKNLIVNDQPITNYSDWVYHVKTEIPAIPDFVNWSEMFHHEQGDMKGKSFQDRYQVAAKKNGSSTEVPRGLTITEDWLLHSTLQTVDAIRIDIVAASGLSEIDGSGDIHAYSVPLEIQYRRVGNYATADEGYQDFYLNALAINDVPAVYRFNIDAEYLTFVYSPDHDGVYRRMIETVIVPASNDTMTSLPGFHAVDWNGNTGTIFRTIGNQQHIINDEDRLRIAPQRIPVGEAFRGSEVPVMFVTGKSRNTLRFSFREDFGIEDNYEIRIRRTEPQQSPDSNTVIDEITLNTVWEIEQDVIGFQNSAMLALQMQMSDQLNSIPSVTFEIEGRRVQVFSGNSSTGSWSQRYSNNPAWVAWDILTSDIGAELDTERLDFHKWLSWAEHCDDKGYEFNGIFDFSTNVWDGLQYVMRAGHANIVRVGTKYSVAIERPETPVMMFGNGNIIKGTMQNTWLSMEERANEVEITYYDEDDSFAEHTIKVYDDTVFSDKQRTSTLSLMGVTSQRRAEKEAALQLNMNKLIRQTVSFETGIDALGVIPGDVILVQSDHPQWGFSGRTLAKEPRDPATLVPLDSKVFMEENKLYVIAFVVPNQVLHDGTEFVRSLGNDWIGVDESVVDGIDVALIANLHITHASGSYRVLEIFDGNKCVVDRGTSALDLLDQIQIVQVDAIVQEFVVTNPGQHDSVQLSRSFPFPIEKGMRFSFGGVNRSAKPFRVTSVDMSKDPYARTIQAIEYDKNVYNEYTGDFHPVDYTARIPAIGDVQNLAVSEQYRIVGGEIVASAEVTWEPPIVGIFAGVNILISVNGAPYEDLIRLNGVPSSFSFDTHVNNHLFFIVQAIGEDGSTYPRSGSARLGVVMNGNPISTGDVLLPEDHYSGGGGNIWFARHRPLDTLVAPLIVDPPLAYVGARAIRIHGGLFLHPDGETRLLRTAGFASSGTYRILDTPFENLFQFRPFYLCYSDEDIRLRFPDMDIGRSDQYQFFITSYNELKAQWNAIGADGQFHPYAPANSDCLVGRGSKIHPVGGIDLLTSFLTVDQDLPDYAATNAKTFHQVSAPNAIADELNEGDFWVASGDGNHMYRWNGSRWVSMRDAGISAALEYAFDLEERLDGKVSIHFSSSAPDPLSVNLSVSDIWLNIVNPQREGWTWDGRAWVAAPDNLLVDGVRDATMASDISDGLIVLYLSDSEPSANVDDQDLWYSAATRNLSQYQSSAGRWEVISIVGTLWDDIDGDGRPDDYVGNTGDQLLVDFNFERAAAGENTWQSYVNQGSVRSGTLPLRHESSTNVLYSNNGGEDGSAAMLMYGAGLGNFVHARNPIVFPAHAGDRYRIKSRLRTNQSVSANGLEGYGMVCHFFNSNFGYVSSSSVGPDEHGPVFNPTNNPNWHTQSNIISVPSEFGSIAYMTITAVLRANNGDSVTVSQIDAIRQDLTIFERLIGENGDEFYGAAFTPGGPGLSGRLTNGGIGEQAVEISAGDEINVNVFLQVSHPADDITTSGEYRAGTYTLALNLDFNGNSGTIKPVLSSPVLTQEDQEFTIISFSSTFVAERSLNRLTTNLQLTNSYSAPRFTDADFAIRQSSILVEKRDAVRSGYG